MGANSKIGWTNHTLNLWWGCVEVAQECDNCYAREWAKRYDRAKWGAKEPRLYIKSGWTDVLKWQAEAAKANRIDNVFCGSMMDIYEKPMPVVDAKGNDMGITTEDLRNRLHAEIVPACPNLLFLLLTKRPQNIPHQFIPPDNVMHGTSIGTKKTQSTAGPHLSHTKGRKFWSMEPLLEPVDVFDPRCGIAIGGMPIVDWVIIGCESLGPKAGRFADGYEDAARDIIQKCDALGVPVFHKQMPINGRMSHDMSEWPDDLCRAGFPERKERSHV